MPGVNVTGPCHHFVDGVYLGTSERSPIIRVRDTYEDVMNALGGVILPFERLPQGSEAFITSLLTRFATDGQGNLGPSCKMGVLGLENPHSTPPAGSACAVRLSLVFPYLNSGINFFLAVLEEFTLEDNSTAAQKMACTWHATPYFNLTGSATLYNTDVSGLTPS